MKYPRIIISATKSGSGKTLLTCALLKALSLRKKKVAAFKCGPDYIDPMFHRKVLGIDSGNLDLYFTDEETTKEMFAQNNQADISVVEGVMGLYDGLGGFSDEASAYHLAKCLKAPVILIVDTHGMGRSVVAEIAGFLSLDTEKRIQGVILNRMTTGLYERLKPVIEEELSVEVLGYFKPMKEIQLDSRYLGLKLPEEVSELDEKVTFAAKALEETVDLNRIIAIAEEAEELFKSSGKKTIDEINAVQSFEKTKDHNCRVAIAMDEAFCFYYKENIELLKKMGAEIVPFSPLTDSKLPEKIQGLILGGGYPELKAKELSLNETMRKSIKEALNGKLPCLAECGGFMYLHESITNQEGTTYPMVGQVEGNCFNTGKLGRFGYIQIENVNKQAPFGMTENLCIRGHEFHYYDSENNGTDCMAVKPLTGKKWECMHAGESFLWGYPHLYYPSNPSLIKAFMEKCREYGR